MLNVTDADLATIVASVFDATLGRRAEWVREPSDASDEVSSSLVGVAGAWDGAVIVACSRALAKDFACVMFGIGGEQIGSEDIQDALGELANMVGGNLKSLLPPTCFL